MLFFEIGKGQAPINRLATISKNKNETLKLLKITTYLDAINENY